MPTPPGLCCTPVATVYVSWEEALPKISTAASTHQRPSQRAVLFFFQSGKVPVPDSGAIPFSIRACTQDKLQSIVFTDLEHWQLSRFQNASFQRLPHKPAFWLSQKPRPTPYYPSVRQGNYRQKKPWKWQLLMDNAMNVHVCHPLNTSVANPTLQKTLGMGFVVPPKAREPFKMAGRLASFVDTWKVLTKDTWELNAIEGYQIPHFKMEGIPTLRTCSA